MNIASSPCPTLVHSDCTQRGRIEEKGFGSFSGCVRVSRANLRVSIVMLAVRDDSTFQCHYVLVPLKERKRSKKINRKICKVDMMNITETYEPKFVPSLVAYQEGNERFANNFAVD